MDGCSVKTDSEHSGQALFGCQTGFPYRMACFQIAQLLVALQHLPGPVLPKGTERQVICALGDWLRSIPNHCSMVASLRRPKPFDQGSNSVSLVTARTQKDKQAHCSTLRVCFAMKQLPPGNLNFLSLSIAIREKMSSAVKALTASSVRCARDRDLCKYGAWHIPTLMLYRRAPLQAQGTTISDSDKPS